MGVYQRNGIWWYEYSFNGKRIRKSAGRDATKEEAKILSAERIKDIRQGRNPELREMPAFSFSEHAKEVIEKHYASKRSGWWAKLNIEKHMIPFFGDMLLGAITPEKIVNYRTRRLGQGVAHGTVNCDGSSWRRTVVIE